MGRAGKRKKYNHFQKNFIPPHIGAFFEHLFIGFSLFFLIHFYSPYVYSPENSQRSFYCFLASISQISRKKSFVFQNLAEQIEILQFSGMERGGAVDTAFCSKSVCGQPHVSSNLTVCARGRNLRIAARLFLCYNEEKVVT